MMLPRQKNCFVPERKQKQLDLGHQKVVQNALFGLFFLNTKQNVHSSEMK